MLFKIVAFISNIPTVSTSVVKPLYPLYRVAQINIYVLTLGGGTSPNFQYLGSAFYKKWDPIRSKIL